MQDPNLATKVSISKDLTSFSFSFMDEKYRTIYDSSNVDYKPSDIVFQTTTGMLYERVIIQGVEYQIKAKRIYTNLYQRNTVKKYDPVDMYSFRILFEVEKL